jgi:hypothetical protein
MKKIFSIFAILIVFSLIVTAGPEGTKGNKAAKATVSISGTVIDDTTGETLAGVTVCLAGCDQSVYTDFDGNFEFNGLTPGEYTVTTKLISYEECTSKVDAKPEKKATLALKLKSK